MPRESKHFASAFRDAVKGALKPLVSDFRTLTAKLDALQIPRSTKHTEDDAKTAVSEDENEDNERRHPAAVPAQPVAVPAQTGAVPAQTGAVPAQPVAVPAQTGVVPAQTGVVPAQPGVVPAQPVVAASQPVAVPSQPAAVPAQQVAVSAQPVAGPKESDFTEEEQTVTIDIHRGSKTKKRKRPNNDNKKGTGKPVTEAAQQVIRDFVNQVSHTGVRGFRQEFAEIKAVVPQYTKMAFAANPTKNRYKDVFCIDSTRAVLTLNVPPETDYIHANWVRMDNLDKVFIATQAPLPATIPDFWRLCFQENVATIVALCNVVEAGKTKGTQYWPLQVGEHVDYGSMTITNKQVTEEQQIYTYTLEVMPAGYSNALFTKLIHMTDWPDRGVPEYCFSVLRVLRKIDKSAPCVVHCSAGIGRTGTIIAIDTVIQRLFSGVPVNVKNVVKDIRTKRASSVQTEAQYVYIISTVLCYIKAKMPSKYQEKVDVFRSEVRKAAMV